MISTHALRYLYLALLVIAASGLLAVAVSRDA